MDRMYKIKNQKCTWNPSSSTLWLIAVKGLAWRKETEGGRGLPADGAVERWWLLCCWRWRCRRRWSCWTVKWCQVLFLIPLSFSSSSATSFLLLFLFFPLWFFYSFFFSSSAGVGVPEQKVGFFFFASRIWSKVLEKGFHRVLGLWVVGW